MSDGTPVTATSAWIKLAPEVDAAVATGSPVVAFETTVLSFGLPYPANLKVGRVCERLVRESGAVPATLGLVEGMVHVGISPEQMEEFCAVGAAVTKVNLQNFAAAVMRGELGAFTVAASMQVCSATGIRVFATGGVGGVHRGFAQTRDVSSDLVALARYPVAVVCAGVKSILDLPATLEHLETLGVPIVGYKTSCLPLFHARESTFNLEVHTNSLQEVAALAQAHWRMGGRGVLVVTPVPEEHAVEPYELEDWISGALRAAEHGRVTGKAVTPFLLKKLEELSHGRSLTTNAALLENNAATGAALARAMADAAA